MKEAVRAKRRVIALYVDLHRANARSMATRTAQLAGDMGFSIALCDDQKAILDLATDGAAVANADLLVTIGGDGTLLRAARIAAPFDIPIFGINTGRLGFLTELDADEANIAELRLALSSGFHTEQRVALQAEVHGHRHFALNDVVVRKGGASRIVPFGLVLDDQVAAHIPSDGIVVATPTGSTAYFLSAGGPIISPGVEAFGIAALLPHTLFARPLIVPTSSTITITCDSEIVHANLETDGDVVADLAPGDVVRVTRHPKPVLFARTAPFDFFSRLESKLRWGASIKAEPR